MMTHYLAGRLDNAQSEAADHLDSAEGSGDEIMWQLENGSLCYLLKQDDQSIRHLERAEILMEDFDRRALLNLRAAGAETAVLVTNLNALPYRGFCRDRIMLPVFKAFAYLGNHDEEGFRVELFKLRENQEKVLADYAEYFRAEQEAVAKEQKKNPAASNSSSAAKVYQERNNAEWKKAVEQTKQTGLRGYGNFMNPLAIWLSGYGYARDLDFENALVDFERLYKAMPGNPLACAYYVWALRRAHRRVPQELMQAAKNMVVPQGMERNTLTVIFASGRSAAFRAVPLYIPIILPRYVALGTVAWPVCEYYDFSGGSLAVTANGKTYQTMPLADMDAILAQEYTERLPGMITRIVLSTAVKEVGSYAVSQTAYQANPWAGVATSLSMSAYKALFNTADTRTWEVLPKSFQLVQVPMPPSRKVELTLPGGVRQTVELSKQARSAILYVNMPQMNQKSCTVRVLEMSSQ